MKSGIARAAAIVVLLGIVAVFVRSGVRILNDPQDFEAFYCAGRAVLAHHDPYLTEPLRGCEIAASIGDGFIPYRELVIPAPLPGYAFAMLVPLALLPLASAVDAYVLAVIASIALTAIVLTKLVRTPLPGIIAVLGLADGMVSLLEGQIVPFTVLALCASALAIKRGRFALGAACAACAAIEPHFALPVLICLASTIPKTRLPLAVCGFVLAAAALLAIGPAANVEYLTSVLPAHARSEAAATGQFSLTTFASLLGAHVSTAILLGNLSYAFMCIVGIVIGRRLARTYDAPEYLVLAPAAFVVFGGLFVHLSQMAIALPLLLVLADRFPKNRASFVAAILLIALPWQDLVENPLLAMSIGIALVSAAVAFYVWHRDVRGIVLTTFTMLAFGFGEHLIFERCPQPVVDPRPALALAERGGNQLAEVTWAAFVRVNQHDAPMLYYDVHLPTWIGLSVMIVTAWRVALVRVSPGTYSAVGAGLASNGDVGAAVAE